MRPLSLRSAQPSRCAEPLLQRALTADINSIVADTVYLADSVDPYRILVCDIFLRGDSCGDIAVFGLMMKDPLVFLSYYKTLFRYST
jgi:hypothetical protein